MSQKDFKRFFLDNILDFLWRQWSGLGVAGGARSEDKWVIDPEALLIFSLEFARYEPRLFDEILDWLCVNGSWIDMQRLRGISKKKGDNIHKLIGASSEFLTTQGQERKWKNLAGLYRHKGAVNIEESLFIDKSGNPYPAADAPDPIFLDYGFNRGPYAPRKISKKINFTANPAIRFLLRSLFGIGSRSECILYLLTHEAGHPSEVANAIGISVRGAQDALIELAESGLVLTRIKGKRKIEYWLSPKRWWEFLKNQPMGDVKTPLWVNWIAVFNALSGVWDVLKEIESQKVSDYMKSSKLHEAMEIFIAREFEKSGLDIPSAPGKGITIEEYAQSFEEFIKRILGSNK